MITSMFSLKKSKLPILLLCLAVLSFAFLSLGGEYFHDFVHHHEQEREQECPLHQLLVQTFVVFVAVLAAIKITVQKYRPDSYQTILSKLQYFLPALRAPPIV